MSSPGFGMSEMMSSDGLFDTDGAFMRDQEITVGVHMSAIELVSLWWCTGVWQTGM